MIRKHISNNDKNYTCIILLNEANKAWNHSLNMVKLTFKVQC